MSSIGRLNVAAIACTLSCIIALLSACTKPKQINPQIGPRPYYLIEDMEPSELKTRLKRCAEGPFYVTVFSIGHRGAPMQFPEHTKESYEAAARMGAGILDCDVTFTKDGELVCRHSQCDLHTTTNILDTGLAAACSVPPDYTSETPFKNVQCCTSDFTLDDFKSLCGKMDAVNPDATSLDKYFGATPNWRTNLYSTGGTLLSHKESIALFKDLGVGMMPELKAPSVGMPFDTDGDQVADFFREDYAQKMIDEYKAAEVNPDQVWVQSFNMHDLVYWIDKEPAFGEQAVFVDGRYDDRQFDHTNSDTWSPSMEKLIADGVNFIAPPMWMLLKVRENGEIGPSEYAKHAQGAGLNIIAWTIERSGRLNDGGGWYYQTLNGTRNRKAGVIDNDGDMMTVLDVLAQKVGILGIFSDWPATVTYYANCMGL